MITLLLFSSSLFIHSYCFISFFLFLFSFFFGGTPILFINVLVASFLIISVKFYILPYVSLLYFFTGEIMPFISKRKDWSAERHDSARCKTVQSTHKLVH